MQFSNNHTKILYVAILLALLLPFIIISYYNIPSADDLCRVNYGSSFDTYFQSISEWYNGHNGRYFNAIIASLPIWYNLYFYKLLFVLFATFFTFSNYKLSQQLIPFLSRKNRLAVSIVVLLFLLVKTPSVSQGFYWLSALTAYLFSFILYLILTSILIKTSLSEAKKVKTKYWILSLLLIFAAIGSQEVTMLVVDFTLIIFLFYHIYSKKKVIFSLLLNLFAWICSALVYFSPGSINRQSYLDGGHFIQSFKSSFSQTQDYLILQIFKDPIIILSSLLLLLYFSAIAKKIKVKNRFHPLLGFFLVFSFVFIVIFVYNYSLGVFKLQAINRLSNLLFFYFSFIWIQFLYIIATYFSEQKLGKQITKLKWITPFLMFYLVFLSFTSSNIKNVYADLFNGTASKYHNHWMLRLDYLRNNEVKDSVIHFPKNEHNPTTISFAVQNKDEIRWFDNCLSENYAFGKQFETVLYKEKPIATYIQQDSSVSKHQIGTGYTLYLTTEKTHTEKYAKLFYPDNLPILVLFAPEEVKTNTRFFLHIKPVNEKDLPQNRREYGFLNLDFYWDTDSNYKIIKLPNYKYKSISIGQLDENGRVWEADINQK